MPQNPTSFQDISSQLEPQYPTLLKMARGLEGALGDNQNVMGRAPAGISDLLPQIPKSKEEFGLMLLSVLAPAVGASISGGGKNVPLAKLLKEVFASKGIHDRINARNTSYHATDPEGFAGILESRGIKPGDAMPHEAGVSVSRVPRVFSKDDKSISFVLNENKMPRTRPFVESGYGKTLNNSGESLQEWAPKNRPDLWEAYQRSNKSSRESGLLSNQLWAAKKEAERGMRNPSFEFENRTFNQDIPTDAIKEVLIDRAANSNPGQIISQAKAKNLPVRVVDDGKALHSDRARQGLADYTNLLQRLLGGQ